MEPTFLKTCCYVRSPSAEYLSRSVFVVHNLLKCRPSVKKTLLSKHTIMQFKGSLMRPNMSPYVITRGFASGNSRTCRHDQSLVCHLIGKLCKAAPSYHWKSNSRADPLAGSALTLASCSARKDLPKLNNMARFGCTFRPSLRSNIALFWIIICIGTLSWWTLVVKNTLRRTFSLSLTCFPTFTISVP